MKLVYKLVISFLLVTAIMGVFGFYMFQAEEARSFQGRVNALADKAS